MPKQFLLQAFFSWFESDLSSPLNPEKTMTRCSNVTLVVRIGVLFGF
jgi:hypothetical protein